MSDLSDFINTRYQELLNKPQFVYVLACAQDKYYVGYSTKLHERLVRHFAGRGAVFTKRYKPQSVLMYRSVLSKTEEFEVFLKFVQVFGEDNVGGFNLDYNCI